MNATLVLFEDLFSTVDAIARQSVETAAVILAAVTGDGVAEPWRLLAQSIHPVPESAYLERSGQHLKIASEGYIPALGEAEARGVTALWFHTHPGLGSSPRPSDHDHQVDREIADLFRLRSGSPLYGTLIASPRESGFAFSGTIQPTTGEATSLSRLWCVGDRFRFLNAVGYEVSVQDEMFDRHVKAFGGAIQSVLSQLRIAVIGCGGTGSAVSEQLVRLGVRNLGLFDPDALSRSNITRVYGSTPADIGQPKVDVLKHHLERIAPDLICQTVAQSVLNQAVARELASFDLIFGCTDDNAGRLILSRIPTYLLTPLIDVGVRISSNPDGTISGIDGRVTVVTPGAGCLVCRDRIDLRRAADEMRTPEERRRLADEGYATALEGVEPAVVTFTTTVAAMAINELLERLSGFGPAERPSEVLIRFHEREVSTNRALPRQAHYCHPQANKTALGSSQPFLEIAWP